MNKNHTRKILQKIETDFDKIVPIVIVIALLSGVFSSIEAAPSHLIWADVTVIFIFTLLLINKNKITIVTKIIVSVLLCFYMGAISYLDVGFQSSGAIMFIGGNIIAVLLLKRIYGIIYTGAVVSLYIIVWQLPPLTENTVVLSDSEWIVQILVYILIGTLLQTVVFSVKKYLMSSIQDLESNAKKIESLAYYDQKTGIPNGSFFKKTLYNKMLLPNVSGYVVYFSIKNFQVFSSMYGEEVTNDLINEVISLIKNNKDKDILLSRVGENTFALWYEGVSKENLYRKFNEYEELFRARNVKNEHKKRIDCYASFCYHQKGDDLEKSMQKAYMAMTYVIENDLNKIVEYDVDFDSKIREIENKKELVKRAIEEKAFDVHFQTKVNGISGEVIGLEALARWTTQEYGSISPVEFIPLIEQLNVSSEFGNIIVKKTLEKYKKLKEKYGEDISVSINVSPKYLMSRHMVANLKASIDLYNVPYNKVIVEVTEEIAIVGLKEVNRKLQKMREIGVKVSLDDFGSGYSSLNYLISFKVDELKIDKSFVDQLEDNPFTTTMFESIIHMVKQLGLVLIVEGVERKEQVDKLLELGCYNFQGYYYSKPEKL